VATRLYLAMNAVPDVSPAFNPDSAFGETNLASRQRFFRAKQAAGEALALGVRHGWTAASSQLDRQFVSDPLIAGIVFTTGVSVMQAQIAAREFAVSDNSRAFSALYVFSRDGGTKRVTLIAASSSASEYINNASLRNVTIWFGGAEVISASYTTVAGDRLVAEFGHLDSAGTTPEGQYRFGCPTGTADHGVNQTETTALVPWFESSVNLIFETPAKSLIIGQAVKRSAEW
jgi:hypothetical protein